MKFDLEKSHCILFYVKQQMLNPLPMTFILQYKLNDTERLSLKKTVYTQQGKCGLGAQLLHESII